MSGHARTRTPSAERSTPAYALVALTALTFAAPAAAYVGPGAGITLIGALWGLITAIVAALAFIIAWPIRRTLKRRRMAREGFPEAQDDADDGDFPRSPHDPRQDR